MVKKIRYSLFLRLLAYIFRKPSHAASSRNIRKIAVLRPGKIGDMLVATPFFEAAFDNGIKDITVICSSYNEIVIRHNPYVRELKAVNFHNMFQVIRLTLWLRRERFDLIVDLTPGMSNTCFLISRCAGAGVALAGLHKKNVADEYDYVFDLDDRHMVDQNIALVEKITGKPISRSYQMKIAAPPEACRDAELFIHRLNETHADSSMFVGINLSAGAKIRQWNADRYEKLIEKLLRNPVAVVLFAVEDQAEWALNFADRYQNVETVPRSSLIIVSEIIRHLQLFISPDTSLISIASSHNVPVAGMYIDHKQTLMRWSPYNVPHEIIRAPEGTTVNEISPREVYAAAVLLLKEVYNVTLRPE
ncbi:MAG: hypothetical protein GF401_13025 [Chitinivibrionales bacterium]|nr:hypothetical protein [Chitinivibrionales bacterium]